MGNSTTIQNGGNHQSHLFKMTAVTLRTEKWRRNTMEAWGLDRGVETRGQDPRDLLEIAACGCEPAAVLRISLVVAVLERLPAEVLLLASQR